MAKRRKRPSPPLVLTPLFGRYPACSERGSLLINLARFLEGRNLLTDGGVKNLKMGLEGRNGVVSLGLQDVRSYAHGLVRDLLTQAPSQWTSATQTYFETYDKGKPRRPTHLQRLYLDWSRDLDWTGLLQACRDHSHLWAELALALDRLEDDSVDKDMLELALKCRECLQPWRSAFVSPGSAKQELLTLLRVLTRDLPAPRLALLVEIAETCTGREDWAGSLVICSHCDYSQARRLRRQGLCYEPLERIALLNLEQQQFDPLFISAFRSFVQSGQSIERLFESISPQDPVRQAVFGSRPGTSWLEAQKEEMYRLIELP